MKIFISFRSESVETARALHCAIERHARRVGCFIYARAVQDQPPSDPPIDQKIPKNGSLFIVWLEAVSPQRKRTFGADSYCAANFRDDIISVIRNANIARFDWRTPSQVMSYCSSCASISPQVCSQSASPTINSVLRKSALAVGRAAETVTCNVLAGLSIDRLFDAGSLGPSQPSPSHFGKQLGIRNLIRSVRISQSVSDGRKFSFHKSDVQPQAHNRIIRFTGFDSQFFLLDDFVSGCLHNLHRSDIPGPVDSLFPQAVHGVGSSQTHCFSDIIDSPAELPNSSASLGVARHSVVANGCDEQEGCDSRGDGMRNEEGITAQQNNGDAQLRPKVPVGVKRCVQDETSDLIEVEKNMAKSGRKSSDNAGGKQDPSLSQEPSGTLEDSRAKVGPDAISEGALPADFADGDEDAADCNVFEFIPQSRGDTAAGAGDGNVAGGTATAEVVDIVEVMRDRGQDVAGETQDVSDDDLEWPGRQWSGRINLDNYAEDVRELRELQGIQSGKVPEALVRNGNDLWRR